MRYRYPHPEFFKDITVPDFENIHGSVILWGGALAALPHTA